MKNKKYRISDFYIGIYVLGLFFTIGLTMIGFFVKENTFIKTFCIILGTIGTVAGLYTVLCDFVSGKFFMNPSGITMCIGFKAYFLSWSNCKEFGIIDVRVEQAASTFWVYCATRPLTAAEKQKFLSKTRRDLSLVHYFQYSKEPFEEMLKYIPEGDAQYLRDQVARIQMNPIEKLYHRK